MSNLVKHPRAGMEAPGRDQASKIRERQAMHRAIESDTGPAESDRGGSENDRGQAEATVRGPDGR